jgi:hypothetical protein
MKTMQSKFPGVCRDCNSRVPKGALIVYHGKGLGISCAVCAEVSADDLPDEDESAGLERGTLASDRGLARRGLTVVRTSSGWSGTRNSRGRCEDAPCCGCCTF